MCNYVVNSHTYSFIWLIKQGIYVRWKQICLVIAIVITRVFSPFCRKYLFRSIKFTAEMNRSNWCLLMVVSIHTPWYLSYPSPSKIYFYPWQNFPLTFLFHLFVLILKIKINMCDLVILANFINPILFTTVFINLIRFYSINPIYFHIIHF